MAYSSQELEAIKFYIDDDGSGSKKLILEKINGALVEVDISGTGGGPSTAGGISFVPTGLIVVSGTNVQAALAQVDAALAARALIVSPTFTGIPIAPALSVTGLTGAVQGGRLVGATTSGAPVTGAHLQGDVVIDRAGLVWVCTASGTPGTWNRIGGVQELDYQSNTTTWSAVTVAAPVDIASVTYTVTTKPVLVHGHSPWVGHSTALKGATLTITDEANVSIPNCTVGMMSSTASAYCSLDVYERNAVPGIYTRKLRGFTGGGTTGAFFNTLNLGRNFMRAVEF